MAWNRRSFMKGTATGAAAVFAGPFGIPALHGADSGKKYRICVIGTGWWGKNIIHEAIASGRVVITGVCDVDRNMRQDAAKQIEEKTGNRPKDYNDFRDMLEAEKPEIVAIATPDHWHPLQTIAAVRAGAHVFCEKPVGHTILEGRAMVKAARECDRKVEIDTHRRFGAHYIAARNFIREGKLGKVAAARVFVHYSSAHFGPADGSLAPDIDPPEYLDWDLYCGPSRLRPYNAYIHPGKFRAYSDFAGGQITDWGVHWFDLMRWTFDEVYPTYVSSVGGQRIRHDNPDTPDIQFVQYHFDSFDAEWEHRYFAGNTAERHNVGIYFYGTKGTVHMGWEDGWTFYPADSSTPYHENPTNLHTRDQHNIPEIWADFIDSIENDRLPLCDVEEGHRSTTIGLLGNLSLKIGRGIHWDGEKEICIGDDEATAMLRRTYREPWVYPDV